MLLITLMLKLMMIWTLFKQLALTVADPLVRTRLGIESKDTANFDGVINDVLSKATDVCQFLYSDLTAKV